MALFNKKKNTSEEQDDLNTGSREKKDGFFKNRKTDFAKFKKKIRITPKFNFGKKKVADRNEEDSRFANEDKPKKVKDKKVKEVKEKKAKEPKPKKEKQPKAEKAKKSDDGTEAEKPKNKKLVIIIVIIAGAVALGSGAFLIVNGMNKPTVEELLLTATQLYNEKKYAEADEIYQKLIKKNSTLVPAYLGHADVQVATEQLEPAIAELTAALESTHDDPLIVAKIEELTPKPEPVVEEAAAESEPPVDFASFGVPNAAVVFVDAAFENVIRESLKKPSGEPIMAWDLVAVKSLKILGDTNAALDSTLNSRNRTESYQVNGVIYTERGKITDLSDLKNFKNLRKLTIAYNNLTNISAIAELKDLQTLGLYCNSITDISALSSLSKLEYLYIYNNEITDITPLQNLTSLKHLWLNKNKITDISAVKGMTNLTELFITDNEVTDISPVSGLTSLGFFYAENNKISNISAIAGLTTLSDVSFVNNPVTDMSPASHIANVNKPYS